MASLLTKNIKILIAKQVYNLLDVAANAYLPADKQSYIYAMLGKQLPWNTGSETATVPLETDNYINGLYKRGIVAKQITLENASFVVDRINWTTGTVYNTYESTSNFYVLNSKDQVFKCLSNNFGAVSTDEPQLTLSTTSLEEPYTMTADGYKWKYLYTINSQSKQKFLSVDWMPVYGNRFVQAAAVSGSIDIVTVTNSGNNYISGTTQNIITVIGDGTGAVLKANVTSTGHVNDIVIQNRGINYTTATLTFNDVSGGAGSAAAATVSIAPHDGHGSDPIYELSASTIMFNVDFKQDESGSIPTDNDFREITLINNPFNYGTVEPAVDTLYTLYTRIKVAPGVGDFNNDEVVYQGATFETATFTADVISFDEVENVLYVNNVFGTLQNNQAIKGYSTSSIRVVTGVTDPTLDLYSGKVLYISDKLPIMRDPSQTERIRFILSF